MLFQRLTKPQNLYTLLVLTLISLSLSLTMVGYHFVETSYRQFFPDVSILRNHYPVAIGKNGRQVVYKFVKQPPAHWIGIKQISSKAVAAILTSEDGNFFHHDGYEPDLIRKAWHENRKAGRYKRGASTITQQVVKNLFLSPEKTLSRKIREVLLAVEVERLFGKKKILETYLNIAEWGPGIYGIEQAARFYFKKSAASLSAREGATLAFLLPNPVGYQRSLKNGYISEFREQRVSSIMQRLWRARHISDDEIASDWDETKLPSTL